MRQLEAALSLQEHQILVTKERAHIAPNELRLSAFGHQMPHLARG